MARLPLCPLTVTVTVTALALSAGVVAVMLVELTTTTFVAAAVPNVTVATEAKFVPVIVTAVPPAGGPLLGDTLLTVGTVTYVNPFVKVPVSPFTVTATFTAPALPAGVVHVICVALTTTTFVAAALPSPP